MNNKRTLLGILTPSSNTILEPVTSAILAGLGDVSAHFGRFRVTEISTGQQSQNQFTIENQLNAARLLADAKVDAMVWSGTSASWLGFEQDHALCQSIQDATATPASSSVLAINELFQRNNVETFGLVSPYTDDIQQAIVANYAAQGWHCVAERHSGEHRNFEFAEISEQTIAEMITDVAQKKPQAIVVMCTNMQGARIAPILERKLGIPIFDSTAAAVWAGLRSANYDPLRVNGWGSLFDIA